MNYLLQPLRIPSGWTVTYNQFSEYDPTTCDDEGLYELTEDLLQLYNNNVQLLIDLGWYPSFDLNGHYTLVLIKNNDWEHPLQKVMTQSKHKIISFIEQWTCYEFFSQYL